MAVTPVFTRVSRHHGDLPDKHALHIGDGVQRAGRENPDV